MPRALILIAALVALAILPAGALAAPKKVRLSFGSAAASVSESTPTYNLKVLRAGSTRGTTTVNLSIDPATTAVAGVHYSFSGAGTLTFAPGDTSKTLPVTIIDNGTFDPPNKKIVFRLSAPSPGGTLLKNNPSTLTILDNDGPGTIDFSSATYSVVESAGLATATVTRNGNPMLSESVHYATSDGSATAPGDYTASSGDLTFGVGEMSKSFQVPIADDQDFEGDEGLNLTLSNAQNLTNPAQPPTLGPSTPATLTIVDDDVPTFAFSSPTYSTTEGDGTKTITVTRGGATNVAASIGYRVDPVAPGSATGGGTDYTLASGTLNFAAGETSKTFVVAITDDGLNEGNETVNLQLRDGTTTVDTAQLSIVDDDNPLPSVQFASPTYSVNESETSATVTVTLSKPVDGDVTVHYATADGAATAGTTATDGTADYEDTSGTLTFLGNSNAPGGVGQTSKTIVVPLHPDTVVEDDEDFSLTLSAPTNSVLGSPASTSVTVVDDDDVGNLEFSRQRYDVSETDGHATITVRRVGGSGGAVSVDYATSDGTADAPGDYATTSGTLNFADGETTKTFDVPVNWDGLAEGDETISLALANPANGADLGTNAASVIHISDDGASAPVQFSASSYNVSETGGPATITVNRTPGSLGGPVTVDYSGSDGTSGTLTFAAGDASKTFQVPVADDNVHTGTRTVNLALSHPGGGTSLGSPATAALNIADDEPASSASSDRTAPKLKITAKKLQKALKTKRLVINVRSNEAAKLAIKANVRKGKKLVRIGKGSKKVGTGKTVTIKLKLNKKALSAIGKSLVKGKAKVVVTVTGTDAAGNKAVVKKSVSVK